MLKNIIFGILVSFLILSCASVRQGSTVVASQNKTDWEENRVETLKSEERIIASEKEAKLREDSENSWGEAFLNTLAVTNVALANANATLSERNLEQEKILLQQAKLQNPKKSETSVILPKSSNSNTEKESIQNHSPERVSKSPSNSNDIETEMNPEVMKIVLGTPTYKNEESVNVNQDDTIPERCNDFTDIDGSLCKVEKIAVCKMNSANFWFCAGPTQLTNSGESGIKGLPEQLKYSGCDTFVDSEKFNGDYMLLYCGTPLKSSENDANTISKLINVNIPVDLLHQRKIFKCENYNDLTCEVVNQ